MCGIAGFESRSEDEDLAASELLGHALHSRGPDGRWLETHGPYRLAQTRLSIIDLSEAVVYPMPNEHGTVWLLFNGEIFNHTELRDELVRRGHTFRTACDAEVVVHGYEEWDLDVFPRLDGMFAVALVDRRSAKLVLTRDRLGIKPLVRTTELPFAFASEVMALAAAGLTRGLIDSAALREYMTFDYVVPPRTGVVGVVHLEPGTAFVRTDAGDEDLVRWARPAVNRELTPQGVTLEEADAALKTAVERQLQADVPVGVFLSGGLDSSLVLSYAVEAGARPMAFTVSFSGRGDYDERPRAAAVARALGVPHRTATVSTSFVESVDDLASGFDQPFADSSAIAMLAVARLARSDVTVALSGTGGDDLFGGYYRHRAHRFRPLLARVPHRLLDAVAHGGTRGGERATRRALFLSYGRRLAEAAVRSDADQYLALVGSRASRDALSLVRFGVDPRVVRVAVGLREGLGSAGQGSRLRELQEFELRTYLPGDLLVKEDRASMAVGVEARVPLLDERVLAVADAAADQQKISRLSGKLLLRELARRRLGPLQARVAKRGFAVPLRSLFEGPWRQEAAEWFAGTPSDLVDTAAVATRLRTGRLDAPDGWTLAALVARETRLRRTLGGGASAHRLDRAESL